MTQSKDLNIQNWSTETVCEWLKGVKSMNSDFISNFEQKQINGKKLILLESSDINELVTGNLAAQLVIYKSIQNFLNTRYNLSKDTLQSLMFNTYNRIKSLLTYSDQVINCANRLQNHECAHCTRLKRDIISNTGSMAISYRKLVSWLIRLPFTRLKAFENFRDDINSKMKHFLKLFKRKLTDHSIVEIKLNLTDLLNCFKKMLDYCDAFCDNENGKMSIAFNCCYLEKVILKRKTDQQILGISLITLIDGLCTVAEIEKESAADECSRLNVEDDLIAVNHQIVVGWDINYLNQFMEQTFKNTNQLSLVLRKMPKEHLTSLKQIQKQPLYSSNNDQHKISSKKSQPQRKHSFSEIFLADENLLYNSSDEEEDDEDEEDDDEIDSDMNSNSSTNDKISNNAENLLSEKRKKLSTDNLYENNTINSANSDQKSKNNKTIASNTRSKLAKLAKKTNKSRLIKSMTNLLAYDRSRSNSNENLNSDNENNKLKKKSSTDESSSKSDIFKSLFSNKKYDLNSNDENASNSNNNKKSASFEQPGTPNLLNIRKIDFNKRLNKVDVLQDVSSSINKDNGTVSRKPPLDKRAYKLQTQKATFQSWLYKRKHPLAISSSSSSINSLSSTSKNTVNPLNNGYYNSNNVVRSISNTSKWKHYWCVLFKDYITFYKYQDDKTPKDFLLLKDFNIVSSGRKNGFMLVDKSKQLEHEFYAETIEDFNNWNQVLSDLKNKQNGEISSGYDTQSNNNNNTNIREEINSNSSISSNNNRKNNNLQLHLSTIIDSNDDLQSNISPTLAKNAQYSSSHESSRDSSPVLNYQYQQEQEIGFTTSESEVEIYGETKAKRKDSIDKKTKKNKLFNSLNTSAGLINNIKQTSCSPSSATSTSSGGAGQHFVYDEEIYNDPFQSHRANSLPGSLQSCVGSLTTPNNNNNNKEIPKTQQHKFQNQNSLDKDTNVISEQQSAKDTKIQSPLNSSTIQSNTSSSYVSSNNNTSNCQKPLSPTGKPQVASIINNSFNNSPQTSLTSITQYPEQLSSNAKSQHHFIFQPHQQLQKQHSLPQSPPPPPGTTRRISVQVGPKGITSINTFNYISNDQQQKQPVLLNSLPNQNYNRPPGPISITSSSSLASNNITNINNTDLNSNSSNNTHNNCNSPVLYRTELTIMPFNPKASSSNLTNQSQLNSNNSQQSTSSNNSPLLKKIQKF